MWDLKHGLSLNVFKCCWIFFLLPLTLLCYVPLFTVHSVLFVSFLTCLPLCLWHTCPFSFFQPTLLHHNTCLLLVWKHLRSLHLQSRTCARSHVKLRRPCSIGRCLRTCVVPRHTAKTTQRPLLLALWRPPLRAWPLPSLFSQALEGRQVTWSWQVTEDTEYRFSAYIRETEQGQRGMSDTAPCLWCVCVCERERDWVTLHPQYLPSFLHGPQIAREAEAATFHRQLFEELRRHSHFTRDPTEAVAVGAVESSFKCCASAIIVLTKTGR